MRRKLIIDFGLGLLLMITVPGCASVLGSAPLFYRAELIEGRVLDAETRQPIEDAVVIAQWILATPPEGHHNNYWIVIEAVTDAEGRYKIPGWGPKWRPRFRWLDHYDPRLVVFKPGYWNKVLHNRYRGNISVGKEIIEGAEIGSFNSKGAMVRKTYWNGKDIMLWPFKFGDVISRDDLATFYYDEVRKRPSTPSERIQVTEKMWTEEISAVQDIVRWDRPRWVWAGKEEIEVRWTAEDWLKIKNLVRIINQECLKLAIGFRREIDEIPEQYHKLLLGDIPPCPKRS